MTYQRIAADGGPWFSLFPQAHQKALQNASNMFPGKVVGSKVVFGEVAIFQTDHNLWAITIKPQQILGIPQAGELKAMLEAATRYAQAFYAASRQTRG